jgi:hypothetical protein
VLPDCIHLFCHSHTVVVFIYIHRWQLCSKLCHLKVKDKTNSLFQHRMRMKRKKLFSTEFQYTFFFGSYIFFLIRSSISNFYLLVLVFIQCSRYPSRWIQNLSLISTYRPTTRVVYMEHYKSIKYNTLRSGYINKKSKHVI